MHLFISGILFYSGAFYFRSLFDKFIFYEYKILFTLLAIQITNANNCAS